MPNTNTKRFCRTGGPSDRFCVAGGPCIGNTAKTHNEKKPMTDLPYSISFSRSYKSKTSE